jgi:pimeloyl-ACP methyl ester carboxylesterase
MPPVAFLVSAVLTSAVVLAATKVFDHKARHILTPGFAELADVGSSVVLVSVVAAAAFSLAFLLTSRRRYNAVIIESRVRHPADRAAYRKACGTAHVVRSGYRAVPILALGALVWLVTATVVLLTQSRPYAANLLLTLFAMAIAALPGLLMTVFRNVGKRRAIGVIWDVTTFWPRAVHPLAPPCYAERVIPQLVSRVEALQERGPVLVSGHSQGAMISSALFQQLPAESVDKAALATYGCQLSFLFARAFPSYCGGFVLDQLATDLGVPATDGQPTRWLNLFRLTDLLGSTVFLSSSYADINREVADPRYARYIKADEAGADITRLQLQLTEWPIAGDLITDTKPLGHSDYPASYEYRLAAQQLDTALGHGTPAPGKTFDG